MTIHAESLDGFDFFFFQAEDGIRDKLVTGVQTCALPISQGARGPGERGDHGGVHRRRRHHHGRARHWARQAAIHAPHFRRGRARRDAGRTAGVRSPRAGESGKGGAGARVSGVGGTVERGTRNAEREIGRSFRLPRSDFRVGNMSLVDRVRALLGDDAVDVAATRDGVPRVAPGSPDAVALLLGTAREEGWRVRVEGAGTWLPVDAPADLALTTRRLDKVPAIEPQDLSATAEAGIGCDLLRQQLADRGTWLALDPPGLAGRTLGSAVAPAAAAVQPAAHELMSPALARRERWMLAVRFAGSAALVSAEEAALRAATGGRFTALRADEAHALWMRAAESFATRPVTFRVGALPDSSDELMDLLQQVHELVA